jgi:putative component of membrane protein insertase Oxa1/YidC/SpoIIIJ protein YidD
MLCILAWTCSASLAAAQNPVISFYQDHISAVDGDRCPMYPSCSHYISQAVEKHGILVGWIMGCDRLIRCGRDEKNVSPSVRINNQQYVYDPVSANDSWWFEQEEKK